MLSKLSIPFYFFIEIYMFFSIILHISNITNLKLSFTLYQYNVNVNLHFVFVNFFVKRFDFFIILYMVRYSPHRLDHRSNFSPGGGQKKTPPPPLAHTPAHKRAQNTHIYILYKRINKYKYKYKNKNKIFDTI